MLRYVSTLKQIADALGKPLTKKRFSIFERASRLEKSLSVNPRKKVSL